MKNPIKDNRIVSDVTFARRLLSRLNRTQASCAMGTEEIEYLTSVANNLLDYQLHTCPESEKAYHLNCDDTLEFKNKEKLQADETDQIVNQ